MTGGRPGWSAAEVARAREIGRRLRIARNRAGLSLGQVEQKSGGRWKAVVAGSYERGDRHVTAARLALLAEFYNCSAGWLMTGEDELCLDGPALLENVFSYLASQTAGELDEMAQRAMQAAEYGPLEVSA